MTGEKNLEALLAQISPALRPETFVFATVPRTMDLSALTPMMVFQEAEGTTLILEEAEATREGIEATFRSRCVTLTVHSALDAVGFMAAVAQRLTAAGISCNAVAGYYHDHIFVPVDRAEDALAVLSPPAPSKG